MYCYIRVLIVCGLRKRHQDPQQHQLLGRYGTIDICPDRWLTIFMLETGLDSIGRLLSNFFVMATWAEPFGGYGTFENTHFPQDWTIFYWAWWLVFAPSMGLFVARISRGEPLNKWCQALSSLVH